MIPVPRARRRLQVEASMVNEDTIIEDSKTIERHYDGLMEDPIDTERESQSRWYHETAMSNVDCDEDEDEEVSEHFNHEDEDLDVNNDDEDEYYTRLDTIVEEDGEDQTITDQLASRNGSCDEKAPSRLISARPQAKMDDDDLSCPRLQSDITVSKSRSNQESKRYKMSEFDESIEKCYSLKSDQPSQTESLKSYSTRDNKTESILTNSQMNNTYGESKYQKYQSYVMSLDKTQIPSTTRLISEHQARERQALFRSLHERQKMCDVFGNHGALDLSMKKERTNDRRLKVTDENRRRPRRRKEQSKSSYSTRLGGSKNEAELSNDGIPLSSVDLTSMSDRMLDELLGNIASASSSSSLSNDSLSSNDLSPNESSASQSDHESRAKSRHFNKYNSKLQNGSQHGNRRPQDDLSDSSDAADDLSQDRSSSAFSQLAPDAKPSARAKDWLPNIVGIHEDESFQLEEQQRKARQQLLKCREAKRRNENDDKDDDFDGDRDFDRNHTHPLNVRVSGAGSSSAGARSYTGNCNGDQLSLSPPLGQSMQADISATSPGFLSGSNRPESSASSSTNLSASLFSNLNRLNLLTVSSSGQAQNHQQQPQQHQQPDTRASGQAQACVESVLAGMLSNLSEMAGTEDRDQLNDLLETGLGQIEQLLNCSLTPGVKDSQMASQKLAASGAIQSNASLMSKDSDYGSDTQSAADCFSSHLTLAGSSNRSQPDSPSFVAAHSGGASKTPQMSPLAVELSYKLFEMLHRLNQRRGSTKQPDEQAISRVKADLEQSSDISSLSNTKSTIDRSNGKSVVLINASPISPTLHPDINSNESSRNLIKPSLDYSEKASCVTPQRDSRAQRQQFKTRISIGDGGQVSNIVLLGNESDQTREQQQVENVRQDQTRQVSIGTFERVQARRSSRSSLRRRKSFNKSTNGNNSRAGSPIPRSILSQAEQQAAAMSQIEPDEIELEPEMASSKQRQLQRALILAQKYNYSPAKLATSKLNSKLGIKTIPKSADSSGATNTANDKTYELRETLSESTEIQQARKQQTVQVTGQIELDISYLAKSGSLIVHVIQCKQLEFLNRRRSSCNPYVKLYLLPDKTRNGKRKSSVLKCDQNPKFDEKFTFGPIQLEQFGQRILWFSVWHHPGRLGANEFLGELLLPLGMVRQQLLSSDLCQSTSKKWYPIQVTKIISPPTVVQKPENLSTVPEHGSKRLSHRDSDASWCSNKESDVEKNNFRDQQMELPPDQKYEDIHDRGTNSMTNNMNLTLPKPSDLQPDSHSTTSSTDPSNSQISGQLFVALKFVPDSQTNTSKRHQMLEGDLYVTIKEAHGIGGFVSGGSGSQQLPSGSLPNPFGKCCLFNPSGQRVSKHKTPQMKRTANPKWNFTCIFKSLKLEQLANQSLEVNLFSPSDSILVSKTYLGGVRLGCPASMISTGLKASMAFGSGSQTAPESLEQDRRSSTQSSGSYYATSDRESRIWANMLAKPNIWSYGELTLRQLQNQSS